MKKLKDIAVKNKVLTIADSDNTYKAVATGQWTPRGFKSNGKPRIVIEVYTKSGLTTVPIDNVAKVEDCSKQPKKGDIVDCYYHKQQKIVGVMDSFYYVSVPNGNYTQIRKPELLAFNPQYYS